jgi:hypothetical protein
MVLVLPRQPACEQGMWWDVDQELALVYLAIDCAIFGLPAVPTSLLD